MLLSFRLETSERLTALRKRGKEKRTLRILLLLFIVVSLVVAYVLFRPVPSIMPPEPDDIQAQRQAAQEWIDARSERKPQPTVLIENPVPPQSHENAYITLCEALELLPKKPEPLEVEVEKQFGIGTHWVAYYSGDFFSLSHIASVSRPDGDPELLSYIENCDNAVEKAREAFAADYFRYPWHHKVQRFFDDLFNAQTGRALFLSRNKSQHAEGLRCLIDAIQTDTIMQSDGIKIVHLNPFLTVHFAFEIAAHIDSPEVLRDSLARFEAMKSWGRPPSVALEAGWKALDQDFRVAGRLVKLSDREDVFNDVLSNMGFEDFYFNTRNSREVRKVKRDIGSNSEGLLKAADLSFPEFIEQLPSLPRVFWDDRVWAGLYKTVLQIQKEYADIRLTRRSIQLILALELFQREYGEYPKKLEELVPGCLAEVPLNPYSDKTFGYQRLDSDYRLSAKRVSVKAKYDDAADELTYKVSHSEFPIHEPGHEH